MKRINFLGFEFESGQQKSGLEDSYNYSKAYFYELSKQNILPADRGAIKSVEKSHIYNRTELLTFNWEPYIQAQKRALFLLEESIPLVNWGGDHSISIASVSAFLKKYPNGNVLWIDAHGDLNLPEVSLTGNLHGMPLSFLLNLNEIQKDYSDWMTELDPLKLIYIGVRDLDFFEVQTIKSLNIKNFSMDLVNKQGLNFVINKIRELTQGAPLHVSFDVDCICSSLTPATGIQVSNGFKWEEVHFLAQQLARSSQITSIDIVEVNPHIGTKEQVSNTYSNVFKFLEKLLNQGDAHARTSRTNKNYDSAQMESSPQI